MSNTLTEEQLLQVQRRVVDFLAHNPFITNRKLRDISGLSYDQAIMFFNTMLARGTLKRTGVASSTKYEIP
jgi:hypothetical protein